MIWPLEEKEEKDACEGRWSDCDLERKKEKLLWKEVEEVEEGQKIGLRDEIRTKKKMISTKEKIKR